MGFNSGFKGLTNFVHTILASSAAPEWSCCTAGQAHLSQTHIFLNSSLRNRQVSGTLHFLLLLKQYFRIDCQFLSTVTFFVYSAWGSDRW